MHGFTAQYLWPNVAWLRENALVVVIPLCQFFALMFSRHFLQIGNSYPRLDRLLAGVAALCLILAVMPVVLDYAVLIRLNAGLVVPVCLGGIAIGCVRWLEGYQPARYFMIAWVTFMLAVAFFTLTKFGLFPRTIVSEYAIQLGAVMEVVLFAFALADRLNSQRRAYEKAQVQALALQKQANERLESSVTERTLELQVAMTDLEQANQRLQALSMQDGLTGIRNRRFFDDKLDQEWQRCLRGQECLALLLIDIDFFKAFNDKYGHLAGDECLKAVAKVIERSLTRPSDSVARYGGEEFAVILPETDVRGAMHVAETIRLAVEQKTIRMDGQALHVTISVGVAAVIPELDQMPSRLVSMADQAMYAAKSAGRNRTRSAPPDAAASTI
jgi:diguanylate cyclase